MKENTVKKYIKGSFEELTKVVWPTKNQAVRLTIVVLVMCLIIAILLGVIDYLFSMVFNYLLNV